MEEMIIYVVATISMGEPKTVRMNSICMNEASARNIKDTLLKTGEYSDVRITPNTIKY